jgi:predicted ATPase
MSIKWCDVDKIQELAHISDYVVDVIAANMSNLHPPTLLALKSASCLGKVVPLHVLVDLSDVVYQKFKDEFNGMMCDSFKHINLHGFKEVLDSAVNFGILTRSDDAEIYTWAHDKLQSVTYSMIPEEQRCKIHATFGELLWKMSRIHPEDEWMLYMATDQMNRVSQCMVMTFEKRLRNLVWKLASCRCTNQFSIRPLR